MSKKKQVNDLSKLWGIKMSATHLVFQTRIASNPVDAKKVIKPAVVVACCDKNGGVDEDCTAKVTIAITPNSGQKDAKLGGTLITSAVKGIATFDTLTIDIGGPVGYTLTATSPGLAPDTCDAFPVD